jgi:hypothetical protein
LSSSQSSALSLSRFPVTKVHGPDINTHWNTLTIAEQDISGAANEGVAGLKQEISSDKLNYY